MYSVENLALRQVSLNNIFDHFRILYFINKAISSPEPSLPLSSGTGKRSTLGKSVLNNVILVIPVKLRRREVLMQCKMASDSSADLGTFRRLWRGNWDKNEIESSFMSLDH